MPTPDNTPREKASLEDLIGKMPQHIAIEGPLCSGKKELACKLAHTLHYASLLENMDENPFIDAFFRQTSSNALASHLYFLFERQQFALDNDAEDSLLPQRITDFIAEKDYFLAKTLLSAKEFSLYHKVFEQITINISKPDLVVYLQMPTESIQRRLELHPYAHLESFSPLFLEQVNDAYRQFFHYYDDTPLLIVNAADVDFIDNTDIFFALIEHITHIQSGRHYFNPEFIPEMSL